MTSAQIHIFFTGATGYIGGSFLDRILSHPQASSYHIAALVRTEAKAKALATLGIESILGSYADLAILEEQSSKADYVLSLASSADEKANEAILRGLKLRFEKTGKAPVLIHASGLAFILDDAKGAYASEVIWKDSDVPSIDAIPATKIHRPVDTTIAKAGQDGYAKTFIIAPSVVYGIPTGRLVDLGVQQTHTTVLKTFIDIAQSGGAAVTPGEGKNIFAYIHVDDCADLFYTIFNNALEGKDFGSGREGFYYGETGEHTALELLTIIGVELHKRGKISSPLPVPASGEAAKHFLIQLFGGNARARSERARATGWQPRIGDASFNKHVREHVIATIDAQ